MWTYQDKKVEPGQVWVTADGVKHSPQWHIWSREEKVAAGLIEVVEDVPERTLAVAKAEKIFRIKSDQHTRLGTTDWLVIRQADTGESIPENISAHRAAIRSRGDEMEAAVDDMTDVDTVDAFNITWPSAG